MSIRLRYWTHYGYLVVLLLITATVSILTLRTLGHAIELILREDYLGTLAGRDMMVAVEREDALILKALVQPVDHRRLIVQLEEARKSFLDALARVRTNVSYPGEAEAVQRIRQTYAAYQDAVDRLLLERDARPVRYVTDLEPRLQALRGEIEAMIVANQEAMQGAGKHARAMVRERTFLMSMVCALGLLSLFVMSRRFDTHVIQPLRRVRDAVIEMAQGDDSRRPPAVDEGEIGDLGRAVTTLADRFEAERAARSVRLEACRRTLQALVELLPDPAVLLSPAGAIVAFNHAFSERLESRHRSASVRDLLANEAEWSVLELPHGQGTLHRARG